MAHRSRSLKERRFWAVAVALLMSLACLSGCTGGTTPDIQTSAVPDESDPVPDCVVGNAPGGPPVVVPPHDGVPLPDGRQHAFVGLPSEAAPAAGLKVYVALGDSFSAGEGAPQYTTGCFDTGTDVSGNRCHRSQEAYPVKVWKQLPGYSLTTVACSGGITDDYFSPNPRNTDEPPQRDVFRKVDASTRPRGVPAAGLAPDLVTVTMGGNDGGFAWVLKWCVEDLIQPLSIADWTREGVTTVACLQRIDKAKNDVVRLTDTTSEPPSPGGRPGHKLVDFYSSLRADAPTAKILVLGYQQFFPDNPPSRCSTGLAAGYFTRQEMIAMNEVVRMANDAIRTETAAAGVGFVDVQDIATSTNATLCQDDKKIRMQNRFIYHDLQRSFHPTIAAHDEEARRVVECVRKALCGGDPIATETSDSGSCLTVGNCGDLPTAPSTPILSAPCDPSTPAPSIDDTARYAIHLDLDGYYRPYDRSEPTPVCGAQTMVVAYANSENATSSPEKIDVRNYDPATQQWKVVQTLDPHDPQNGPSSQPYVPSEGSCQSDCIQTAHLTDGDIDFLVQGGNATLANGMTVVSEKDGVWRLVPFLDKPPSTGSTNYVPAATLSGNDIHVDLNDCKPDCTNGGHTTVVYSYKRDVQGFEGTLVDGPGRTGSNGDLGLAVPIANQTCTGQYITLIGSSTDPSQYQAEVQSFLTAHPGSSYLVTDQSCAALVSSVNGKRVYAAYLGPFATAAQACSAAEPGSYVKMLNDVNPDAALIAC